MKAQRTLLFILLIFLSLNLSAKQVNINEARLVAKNFIYITANQFGPSTTYQDINLVNTYIYKEKGIPEFYAFDLDEGFIIISAEDAFVPVIGYAFKGSFQLDNAPANYKSFIQSYAEQIQGIRKQQLKPDAGISAQWNSLLIKNPNELQINRDIRDVEPLLSCEWNQGSPFNLLCPEDPSGPGGHVWVGCVATAMAQIMYYWRYPAVGTGSHCYTPAHISYGQQCANFGETYYDWNGMVNQVYNNNPLPNAELQYQCAVAVNMNFGPDGSGSNSFIVPSRLDQYFRYHDAEYLEKQNYNLSTWINMLKSEIDQARPMYYSGDDGTTGHAFVCDGYQGDYFDFNFGWSGQGNGYYSLSDVGGFHNNQGIVRYFYPSESDYPYYASGSKILNDRSGSITDGSGPINNYMDNSNASWLIDPQTVEDSISSITFKLSKIDLLPGDSVKVYDGADSNAPLLGSYSGSVLPLQVSSTQNKMYITFSSDGSGNASGFYAEFTSSSPTWCTGMKTFTEPSGSFDDGSGNFFYQGGAACRYLINPESANTITLWFNSFETEEGADVVNVYDGTVNIGTFSGNQLPESLVATSGTMFITWTTNQTINMQGWDASYEVDNVGIQETVNIDKVSVYPNPAVEKLNVDFRSAARQDITVQLMTITGKILYIDKMYDFEGNYQKSIDVSSFAKGMYFLRIKTSTGEMNKKIVIG